MTSTWRSSTIERPDGVQLAMWVRDPDEAPAPTIVLVHGYPDTHVMWEPLADRLPSRFRVVSYDVRGAGGSTAPAGTDGYRLEQLADDLAAVCRFTAADGPAHVVGHDWGGILGFEAVTLPRTAKALASLTAVSAASLDHTGEWLRRRLRPSRRWPADLAVVGGQLARSWYVGAFQLPFAPRVMATVGVRMADRIDGIGQGTRPVAATAPVDAANGVQLYRANGGRLRRPRRGPSLVPLQVVHGDGDPFVSPHLHDDLEDWAPQAVRHVLPGGHWLPVTQAPALAALITTFVDEVEHDPTSASHTG